MVYAIVDLLWAKSHGIEILPEMRTSVDQSKVILNEEMLLPFSDEDFPRYSFSDPEFINLLSSDEWTYPEGEEPVINKYNTYELIPSEALQIIRSLSRMDCCFTVKVGERYLSDDILWECIQGHTTQDNWKPSMATASSWKTVDEDHKGTIDDPIVYIPPMEIFKDKYYIQNGIKYKCTRNSEQPLTHDLSALVGLYVEKV